MFRSLESFFNQSRSFQVPSSAISQIVPEVSFSAGGLHTTGAGGVGRRGYLLAYAPHQTFTEEKCPITVNGMNILSKWLFHSPGLRLTLPAERGKIYFGGL